MTDSRSRFAGGAGPITSGLALGVTINMYRNLKEGAGSLLDHQAVLFSLALVPAMLGLWWLGSLLLARLGKLDLTSTRIAHGRTYFLLVVWLLYPLKNALLNILLPASFFYLFALLQWYILIVGRLRPFARPLLLIALLPLALLLSVATLEIKLRLRSGAFAQTVQEGVVYFDQAPYLMMRARPNQDVTLPPHLSVMNHNEGATRIRTNELGYRGPMPTRDSTVFRILMLGGSVVWNGSDDSHTIPGQLAAILGESLPGSPEVVCWNGGLTGCISNQEVLVYLNDFLPYEPDLVVVLDGINDFWTPHLYEKRIGYPMNYSEFELSFAGRVLGKYSYIYNRWLVDSKNYGGRALGYAWPWSDEARSGMQAALENYIVNLRRVADLNRRLDVPTFFYLQPARYYSLDTTIVPTRPREWSDHMVILSDWYYKNAWKRFQELNSEYASSPIRFGELTRLGLGDRPEMFWDLCHVYDDGNRIIAERMASDIAPVIALRLAAKRNMPPKFN